MMFEVRFFFCDVESIEVKFDKFDKVEFVEDKFDEIDAEFDEVPKELEYGENAINVDSELGFLIGTLLNLAIMLGHLTWLNFSELSALQKRHKLRKLLDFCVISLRARSLTTLAMNSKLHLQFLKRWTLKDISPIYKFLKVKGVEIKWNFEKVLIEKDGKIHGKFTTASTLLDVF
ncbi:hypothetical protein Cgig2_006711 [Carnegiea gigantea]|uniref:Uncharacterized protein n=1 Tax=Carnegiea gigantea TaxID=171969 RepID=A0A9Q1JSK5_9CARY|nr:hypothetical protein Cgig2_006711 [Carnegiea gigantea]